MSQKSNASKAVFSAIIVLFNVCNTLSVLNLTYHICKGCEEDRDAKRRDYKDL
jgi:hypothetical protein